MMLSVTFLHVILTAACITTLAIMLCLNNMLCIVLHFVVMLNVIKLRVVRLHVVMLSVVILSDVMVSVVAPGGDMKSG
jgi:hypothetical protein